MPNPPVTLASPVAAALPSLLRRSLIAGALALAALVVTFVTLYVAESGATRWVSHSRNVLREARMALAGAIELQTSARGYLLDGDSVSLTRAIGARGRIDARIDGLLQLTTDDPAKHSRIRAIEAALADWMRVFLVPATTGQIDDPLAIMEHERVLFGAVQQRFEDLIGFEDQLHAERARHLARMRWGGLLLLFAEVIVIGIVLTLTARRLREQARQLVEQQATLEEQAMELEEQAAELEQQTDEAQSLAQDLEISNDELSETVGELRAARIAEQASDRARHEALSQLDAALSSAPIGFAFYDRDMRCQRINPSLARINGLAPEQHIGRRISEFLPPLAPFVEPHLARVLETGAPVLNVAVADPPIGERERARSFLASYYPIEANEGGTVGVGVVVVETTDQQQLEAQLRQAQKMEAVGQLAGGIAHDFNNMLTAIKSFSELALDALAPDHPVRDDVTEIKGAADRAAALTRQLLAFSRRQLLQPVVLDLNGVSRGLEEMLARLLGSHIECAWKLAPALDLVRADPNQIEQIIMNLAVNARDAMPNGGRLIIETENVAIDAACAARVGDLAQGPYVTLAITDTGTGMDRATQARIFEPFFTTKDPGKGTGLGLSTVFGIVKQSGGHITVYSEPGNGTTFRIYLPRAEVARAATHASAPNGAVRGGNETILLVEDDPAVRLVAMRILSRHGYEVLQASSPAEALAIVHRHPRDIDLLFTDLILPEVTGRELAERLLAVRPTMRLLYMSGYTDDAVIRRGLLEPGTPFLSKPFTVDGVARAVRAVLESARQEG